MRNLLKYCSLLIALTVAALTYAGNPSVVVGQTTFNGSAKYLYVIKNGSAGKLTSITIGFNYLANSPEMATMPVGWSIGSGLPGTSYAAPSGWQAQVVTREETDKFSIRFEAQDAAHALAPGAQLGGFSILVPQADTTYSSSHWFSVDNESNTSFGTLILAQAPTLSDVSASPNTIWPPNHTMTPVGLAYTFNDAVDPSPTVTINITCNEVQNGTGDGNTSTDWQVLGLKSVLLRAERAGTGQDRLYWIDVTVTNAIGLSVTKRVTVTVPKSQN